MGNRLLTPVLLLMASIPCLVPACRCSQDPEALSYDQACEEIGFSLANRTVTCGEAGDKGNEAFEEFTSSFQCRSGELADAGPDSGTFASILDCAQAMLTVPCDLLVAPKGSLGTALASSPACAGVVQSVADAQSEGGGCPNGQTRCSEYCVNLQADESNCGACGNACTGNDDLNYASACVEGACKSHCINGRVDCDGDMANGCESNWMEDPVNCLQCGKVCPASPYPGQVPVCHQAICGYECDTQHLDCDSNTDNGCETLIGTTNCFACGADCNQNGLVVGECRIDAKACSVISTCPEAALNCDTNADCEASWDVDHCGGCSVKCPAPANATPVCGDGGCTMECLSGFLDCNTDPSDGCEVQAASCP